MLGQWFATAVLFAAFRIPVLRVRVRPPTMVQTTAFVRLWLSMPLWEVLEEWLPAPSSVLLLAVSSFGARLDSIVAAKLHQQRRYTYLVESVLPAVTRGVYCPGLECVASGFLRLDCGAGALLANLQGNLQLLPVDEDPVEPLVRWCCSNGQGTFLDAWNLWNEPSPQWQALSLFFQDPEVQITEVRRYHRPDASYLIVLLLCGTLRAALKVFQKPAVIDADA